MISTSTDRKGRPVKVPLQSHDLDDKGSLTPAAKQRLEKQREKPVEPTKGEGQADG